MAVRKDIKIEYINSRWREWRERPRKGEVFVGRINDNVYNILFLCTGSDIVYLCDNSTRLSCGSEFFTHWMPVGEMVCV